MKCDKCESGMVLIDCCTFACLKCHRLLVDKRRAAKKLRELEARQEALMTMRIEEGVE